MNIFDSLHDQEKTIIRSLERFVENYPRIDDTERMERIGRILDLFRAHVDLEENYLYPLSRDHKAIRKELSRLHDEHDQMEEMIHQLTMVHVDEPHHYFINKAQRLLRQFRDHARTEEETVFPHIAENLSPEERENIEERLTPIV